MKNVVAKLMSTCILLCAVSSAWAEEASEMPDDGRKAQISEETQMEEYSFFEKESTESVQNVEANKENSLVIESSVEASVPQAETTVMPQEESQTTME